MSERQGRPPVSLVITSRKGGTALLDCVEAFSRAGDDRLELIVAECAEPKWASTVSARFPDARVLHFDEPRTIPELRAAGLLAARSGIVALTTDHCQPAPAWLEALRRAHGEAAASAIGGAVEYETPGGLLDWAVFFCEYGRYMLPFSRGLTTDLPAQNVSYTRAAIQSFSDLLAPATWEPLWHWRLLERGHTLVRDPSIVVSLRKHFDLSGFLRERFHFGRSFAAERLSNRSFVIRLGYAAATILLPAVLLFRIVRPVIAKARHRMALVLSLPYLTLFTIVWAAGEFAGAVAGPGASAQRID